MLREKVISGNDAGVVAGVLVQRSCLLCEQRIRFPGTQLGLLLQYVVDHLRLLLNQEGPVLQHLLDEGSAKEPKD